MKQSFKTTHKLSQINTPYQHQSPLQSNFPPLFKPPLETILETVKFNHYKNINPKKSTQPYYLNNTPPTINLHNSNLHNSNTNLGKSNINLGKSNINLGKSNINLDNSNINLDKSHINLDKSHIKASSKSQAVILKHKLQKQKQAMSSPQSIKKKTIFPNPNKYKSKVVQTERSFESNSSSSISSPLQLCAHQSFPILSAHHTSKPTIKKVFPKSQTMKQSFHSSKSISTSQIITHQSSLNEPFIKGYKLSSSKIQSSPQAYFPLRNIVKVKSELKLINKKQALNSLKQQYQMSFNNYRTKTQGQSQPISTSPITLSTFLNAETITHKFTKKPQKFIHAFSDLSQSIHQIFDMNIDEFVLGQQLGYGKFGCVSISRHRKTGFICALKQIKKSIIKREKIVEQVLRQIKIQYFLNHPNIVKLYGFFDDQQNIYLLLELCADGQLYRVLQNKKKFNEEDTCHIIRQLTEAIHEMHQNSIIHRDIKPQNIVISFGMCKICDFGWSIQNKQQFRNTVCGTPLYFSPQLLREGGYNEKIDVWALGVMAYQMMTGSPPFVITRSPQLMKIVYADIYYPLSMSILARQFIQKLLLKDPQSRISINDALKHRFFHQYNDNLDAARSKSTVRLISLF